MANRIVGFYTGESPDHAGRFLRDIQQWPDEQLELVHDFIQWLFPLREPSPVNPRAPVLDRETVEAFAARPELRENLRASFLRMLRFYGLEWTASGVQPSADFAEHSAMWMHPGNHNHLRITRILKCLTLLGLSVAAMAFFECLEKLYRQNPGVITAQTFRYWEEAIR